LNDTDPLNFLQISKEISERGLLGEYKNDYTGGNVR
jgi:hypothetical protein